MWLRPAPPRCRLLDRAWTCQLLDPMRDLSRGAAPPLPLRPTRRRAAASCQSGTPSSSTVGALSKDRFAAYRGLFELLGPCMHRGSWFVIVRDDSLQRFGSFTHREQTTSDHNRNVKCGHGLWCACGVGHAQALPSRAVSAGGHGCGLHRHKRRPCRAEVAGGAPTRGLRSVQSSHLLASAQLGPR